MSKGARSGIDPLEERREDSLEGEREAGAQAALIICEQKQRAVTQNIRAIAFGEQIPHLEQRLQASRSVACDVNGLAQPDVEEWRGGVLREGRDFSDGASGCQR